MGTWVEGQILLFVSNRDFRENQWDFMIDKKEVVSIGNRI